MPMEDYWTARVKNPDLFKEDSFVWKKLGKGISALMGKLKSGGDSLVIQSYRFSKSKYTKTQAKAWLKKEGIKYTEFAMIKLPEEDLSMGTDKDKKDKVPQDDSQDHLRETISDFLGGYVIPIKSQEEKIPDSESVSLLYRTKVSKTPTDSDKETKDG